MSSFRTRQQARGLVRSLNDEFKQLDFEYVRTSVDTTFPHDCCKIDLHGLDDPINGFYLGPVWREFYGIANKDRWATHGITLEGPDLEGIMHFGVEVGERMDKVGGSIRKFLELYADAGAKLKSTREKPQKDIEQNIRQTAKILGYTRLLRKVSIADCAFGYTYRAMPPEGQKEFIRLMRYALGDPSDPNWQKLQEGLISEGIVKSRVDNTPSLSLPLP